MSGRLRIALIGPARFGVAEPFDGGLERHTAVIGRALQRQGHDVTVFAGPATAAVPVDLDVRPVVASEPLVEPGTRIDVAMPPGRSLAEDVGYRAVLAAVVEGGYDVVHNNSLHYLPVVLDRRLGLPMVHTLHTPPFDWLDRAHRARNSAGGNPSAVVAVSRTLRELWGLRSAVVIPNGIELDAWPLGDGSGGYCIWAGRIVPEKAPHLAIDAARSAGCAIVVVGPVQDSAYFDREIRPRLGSGASWLGHCSTAELARWCGRATVGVVTPCWDEPFGLVAVEFLASGTPVAALDRGALREIVDPAVGALADGPSAASLANAIHAARTASRRVCRKTAEARFSAETMAEHYVDTYRRLGSA